MHRPGTHDIIPINNDFNVVWTKWDKGTTFRRFPENWSGLKRWDYLAPVENIQLTSLITRGVEWMRCEHVSYHVSGVVEYKYSGKEDIVLDTGLPGHHNVEHGSGYLPTQPFERLIVEEHVTCCILGNPDRPQHGLHSFEIITDDELLVPASFIHYVAGPLVKSSIYNKSGNFEIVGTAIIGRVHA